METRMARKHSFVGIFLLLLATILVLGAVYLGIFGIEKKEPIQKIPREARSFLLITTDTTRPDHLSPYRAEDIETPAIQALADEGIVFENAFAVAPITLVSHSSMLTGLYPPHHGIRNNGLHFLSPEITTLAETLKSEGFRTAAFISAAVLDRRYGLNQGFEIYDDDLSEGGNRRARMVPDRPAGQTVAEALKWLDSLKPGEKFFLWVHLYDPHAVYSPPPPFRDRYRENLYDGEIAYMDSEIGHLLENPRLRPESGTGIALMADHGESLGEHGEETHALLAYDSTLHVPLILRFPGATAGFHTDVPVCGIDIMPTILDLLGEKVPQGLDGTSIPSLLEVSGTPRSLYAETYLPFYTYGWAKLKVLRKGPFKLILGPGPELYDTERDPHELSNLYEREPSEVHDLTVELEKLEDSWKDSEHEVNLELDQEAQAQLRALGYLASGDVTPRNEGERPNPRDMIDIHVGLERARRLSSIGLYDQAVEVLQGVLKKDPGNLAALMDLADNFNDMGRKDEALQTASRAIELDPGFVRGYILLAALEMGNHQPQKALVLLDKALELDPRNLDALLKKVNVLKRLKKQADMEQLLDQLITEFPEQPNVNVAYARFLELPRGKQEEAENRLRRALERDPYVSSAWKLLGEILQKKHDTEGAIAVYREGLRRTPDAAELHGDLGLLLSAIGRGREAVPHLMEALRLSTVFRPDLHVALGALAAEAGRFEEARKHYDLVLEREPSNAAARNNRAIALYRSGRPAEAEKELKALVAEHPKYSDALNNLAGIAVDQGHWKEAEDWARRTLKLKPESYEAHNNLGVALDETGRHTEAEKQFREALKIEPEYRTAQVNLGITLAKLGKSEEAAEVLEGTLNSVPSDPLVHLELGDLYAGPLHDKSRAKLHYNAFLSAAPGHPRAGEIRRKLTLLSD